MFKIPVSWLSVMLGSTESNCAVKFCAAEGAGAGGITPDAGTLAGCPFACGGAAAFTTGDGGGRYGNLGGNIHRLVGGGHCGPQRKRRHGLFGCPRHL